ncbi:MAG: helix-hairpin-helix domain-containing protein [Chitinophagales bacterium]
MLKFIQEYFSLSNSEQKGIIALTILIFIVLAASRISANLLYREEILEDNSALLSSFYSKENQEEQEANQAESLELSLFNFDPNTISKEDLILLGFSESNANTLINYRNKGGRFYQKEDLLKIYGVSNDFYQQLASYIQIEEKSVYEKLNYQASNNPVKNAVTEKVFLNINTADSAALTQIKGIGKVFASRIIKYRKLLGGYYSTLQLLEVYGITEEIYSSISDQIYAEGAVKKININEASWYELKSHPYLDSEKANKILDFKKKNTTILELESLLNQSILDTLAFSKLQAYLKLEE